MPAKSLPSGYTTIVDLIEELAMLDITTALVVDRGEPFPDGDEGDGPSPIVIVVDRKQIGGGP